MQELRSLDQDIDESAPGNERHKADDGGPHPGIRGGDRAVIIGRLNSMYREKNAARASKLSLMISLKNGAVVRLRREHSLLVFGLPDRKSRFC